MMKKLSLPALGLAMLLGGCATYVPPSGVSGFSAVLPALASSDAGRYLTYSDLRILDGVARDNLEFRQTGDTDFWRNSDTRHAGSVTSLSVLYRADGTPCRDLEQTAVVNSLVARARGRACRAPNGVWEVVQSYLLPVGWNDPSGMPLPPVGPGPGYHPPVNTHPTHNTHPTTNPVLTPGQPGNWQTLGDSLAPGGGHRPTSGWQNEGF